MTWPPYPSQKAPDIDLDSSINSEPVGHLAALFQVNAATWEGGALQYGGRTTYLCQGDPVGEHPRSFWSFWSVMHLILTKSSSIYTKSYSMTFSCWKGGKALRTCKTPRILRAYRMVSKPTQDWKTVGGQKIFLLFGKRRPSTEVKQWMLRSMCNDCPDTHHVTNRSHTITRHNDPNNRAEQTSIPLTNPG